MRLAILLTLSSCTPQTDLCAAVEDYEIACVESGGQLKHSLYEGTWIMWCDDGMAHDVQIVEE